MGDGEAVEPPVVPPATPIPDVIRNFSTRNWRAWVKEEEEEELPLELKEQAKEAVIEAVNASVVIAKTDDTGPALLKAMEALEAYENAYKSAYKSAYVAEEIAEKWRQDIAKEKRRRSLLLLLLH